MAYGPELSDGRYRNMRLAVQGLATEVGTGTASSAAVTINDLAGLITTEALTTAQNAIATVTLTNDKVAVGDLVFWSIGDGTNTQGTPMMMQATVSASTIVFEIVNKHASAEAFNGTLLIRFFIVKAL
jgi:hypothetical protein